MKTQRDLAVLHFNLTSKIAQKKLLKKVVKRELDLTRKMSLSFLARTAFEKMTDVDYIGETYYTIRNLSLYECQVSPLYSGWKKPSN